VTTNGDLKVVSDEPHCASEGLSDSVKHGTERLPCGGDGGIFMTDDNCELQQGDSMPKIEPKVSGRLTEDSVPSVSGCTDVLLNGSADRVGEISGDPLTCHVADGGLSNKVLCASFGGVSPSKYSGCMYDMVDKAPEVTQCEEAGLAGEGVVLCDGALLKTSLDDRQMRCKEPHCYTVGFSKFDIQQLPHDMEAVLLKKDVNRELEKDGLLPKIEAKVSSPAHEDSVPSTFGRNLAVYLDGKDGVIGEISEHKTGMEKMACGSLGGGMLSGESGFWEEAPGGENQFSRMEGCHANRGLGHQDFSGDELGCPDHLALELNACNSVLDKPCSTVYVENGNEEEVENQNSESISVSRRRNPRRSASSRNTSVEKHDQICKGSNSSRKSKKVGSSCSLAESTIIKFPKKITKVRSGINRPLKSTAWGSLQKLTGGFGQNGEPSTSNSHLISLENGRSHKRSGKKEQPSVRKSRGSRCEKNKSPPFSAMGFTSDELNGQPTFSVNSDTYASSEGYIGNFPRSDLSALVNGSGDACKTAQRMSIQTDLQQLDRCPAYICGDFAKATSEPSLNIAGVGFSPDSVLEVASATCENNTSASALSTSDSGKNLASSSADLEQWVQTVRGDESTGNEEINLAQAISGYIGEGKVQVLEKSNAVRKSKKVGKQERQKKDGTKGKNIKNRGSTKITSKHGAFSDDSYSLVPSVPPKPGSYFELVTSVRQCISMHEDESMQGPSVTGKEETSALDNIKSLRRKKSDDSEGKKDTMWDPYVKGKGMKKKYSR
jgi:histone-lysine N-methyltransferase SETD2